MTNLTFFVKKTIKIIKKIVPPPATEPAVIPAIVAVLRPPPPGGVGVGSGVNLPSAANPHVEK